MTIWHEAGCTTGNGHDELEPPETRGRRDPGPACGTSQELFGDARDGSPPLEARLRALEEELRGSRALAQALVVSRAARVVSHSCRVTPSC